MTHLEIVEISSDDDEEKHLNVDDGQPESSKRTNELFPGAKRVVTIDSDVEDFDIDWVLDYRFPDPPRMKRQKLDHALNLAAAWDDTNAFDLTDNDDTNQSSHVTINHHHHHLHLQEPFPLLDRPDTGNDPAILALKLVAFSNSKMPDNLENTNRPLPEKDPGGDGRESELDSQPYYDDLKLEARMYRGPGYERFPIVLGTIPEHYDICDEWDRLQNQQGRRQSRRESYRYGSGLNSDDIMDIDSTEQETNGILETAKMELECLYTIREVLPNVDRDFALGKIRDAMVAYHGGKDSAAQLAPDPAYIVSDILELPDYPKQEKLNKTREPAADGTGVTIEWRKGDSENKSYQTDAVCLLASQFSYVPTHFIHKAVQEKNSLFDSYLYILELNSNYDKLQSKERLYRRSHNPRLSLEKKYMVKGNSSRSRSRWENLVNELQAAKQHAERRRLQVAKEEQEQAEEAANLQDHKASGNLVECQCCFDDEIPINRAGSCGSADAHWFCFACILGLAENQVGSMKHEMLCMHQSGCKSSLSREGLARAIPAKLLDKLAFYQQQFEIIAARIEGLEQCPFCDFKAICDPIEVSAIFQCQNPDCQRVTCRRCHEDSHLPKSCEEFKNDKRVSARHQVEEARSEAMMRSCPRCKVKIVKEVGCNKMKCTQCGCVMCYVCKIDISSRKDGGYGHFHEPGAKCILYDKNFDRHEAEANEAEKEAIKKVQAENSDIDEQQLKFSVNIEKKGKQPAKKHDELGLGWGQAVGEFPFLGVPAFENVYHPRPARLDGLHGRAGGGRRHRGGPRQDDFRPANPLPPQRNPEPVPAAASQRDHQIDRVMQWLHDNEGQADLAVQEAESQSSNSLPVGSWMPMPVPTPAGTLPANLAGRPPAAFGEQWGFNRHFPTATANLWNTGTREHAAIPPPMPLPPVVNPVHNHQPGHAALLPPWGAMNDLPYHPHKSFAQPQAQDWRQNQIEINGGAVADGLFAHTENGPVNFGVLRGTGKVDEQGEQLNQIVGPETWGLVGGYFGHEGENDYVHLRQAGVPAHASNGLLENAGLFNFGF